MYRFFVGILLVIHWYFIDNFGNRQFLKTQWQHCFYLFFFSSIFERKKDDFEMCLKGVEGSFKGVCRVFEGCCKVFEGYLEK